MPSFSAELQRPVAGTADRDAQHVGEPLGAADILRLVAARIGAGAVEESEPHLDRILTGRMRDVVHRAFDRPEGPAGRDRAKLAGRRRILRQLVFEVAHGVIGDRVPIIGAVDGEAVVRALLVHGRRQERRDTPARGRPGADHVVLHGDGMAVGIEPDLDFLVGQRPGEIHLHVVFARIDQLHRLADGFRGRDRRNGHVGLQPAPEAAAQIVLMDDDVLGIDTGHRSRDQRGAGVELIAGIDMPGAVLFHAPARSSARAAHGC